MFVPAGERSEVDSPFTGPRAGLGESPGAADTVIIAAAVVAALSFGREVLVPIALAVLLSFVLSPLASLLARLRIGKVASVLLAVVIGFGLLIGLGALIGKQVAQLSDNLPQYQEVIGRKLESLRSSDLGKGVVEKASDALQGLNGQLNNPGKEPASSAPGGGAPASAARTLLPVEVHEPAPGPVQILQSILSALLPPLATALVVVIFVVFILLQQGDIRDRFIGLTGAHDLHRTTKALDEAALRLSRYFLAVTGVNAFFGLAIGVGLALLGVPNPILWGIVGAVLRFVPYIGAVIGAAFPLALAAAVDPGWSTVVETALLFLVLEAAMSQIVEPMLFGHTTGMSPLAIIVAAAFWTLIWGPPGLLLSTPITACLVVLGRHIESLRFIELLLGDKPALSPVQSFYQRILASDPDEVAYQAEALLKDATLSGYYESVAMPGLALAQADIARGVLLAARQGEICASVERVVDDLADHAEPTEGEDDAQTDPVGDEANVAPEPNSPSNKRSALCIAGQTPLDQAACAILAQLIEREGAAANVLGPEALTTRGIFSLDAHGADVICVVYLDHRSIASIRYAVRRLRKKFPATPIAVCLWGAVDLSAMADSARADATLGTIAEAVAYCAREPQSTQASQETPVVARVG